MSKSVEWSQQFTSLDGRGAEVVVEKGVGTVTRIEASGSAKTVNVSITVDQPKIKYPFTGWLNVADSNLLDILEEAKATGRQVHFRIEMQRKASVPVETPMKELRANTTVAAENTVRKFTAVQFIDVDAPLVESSEVGTDPSNDPASAGGTVRATASNSAQPASTQSSGDQPMNTSPAAQVTVQQLRDTAESKLPRAVLDQLAALALSQGMPTNAVLDAIVGKKRPVDNSTPQVTGGNLAREEQSWKEFNADGSRNLGYLGIMGTVSAEHVVTSIFLKREVIHAGNITDYDKASLVNHVVSLITSISDRVFMEMYAGTKSLDRSAHSHTRARGITYDTVENIVPIPEVTTLEGNEEIFKAWARAVLEVVLHRFQLAVRVYIGIKEPRPIVDENIYVNTLESTTGELSGPEISSRMVKLWEDSGLGEDKSGLSHLLKFIFGTHLIKDIPAELMVGFLDFYESEERSLRAGIEKYLELSN